MPSATTPSQQPETSPKPARKPSHPPQAGGFDPFAGQASEEEADDADLKPGSRKDLWTCPHCGTGNRPNRDTCRSCGKSPNDPVVPPWFKQPKILGVIAAVVVVLIIVVMTLGGPNYNLGSPTADGISEAAVFEEAMGDVIPLANGTSFQQRGRFAAVGRVIAVAEVDGQRKVTLAFGDRVRDPSEQVIIRRQEVGIQNALGNIVAVPYAAITLIDPNARMYEEAAVGNIIALTGHWGDVGRRDPSPANNQFMVKVAAFRHGTSVEP